MNEIIKLKNIVEQIKAITKSIEYKPAPGLANKGNTCFFNAMTQLVYRIKDFVVKDHVEYKGGEEAVQINYFFELLNQMRFFKGDIFNEYLSETKIVEICKLIRGDERPSQEDSNEMLTLLNVYINDDLFKVKIIELQCDMKEEIKQITQNNKKNIDENKLIIDYPIDKIKTCKPFIIKNESLETPCPIKVNNFNKQKNLQDILDDLSYEPIHMRSVNNEIYNKINEDIENIFVRKIIYRPNKYFIIPLSLFEKANNKLVKIQHDITFTDPLKIDGINYNLVAHVVHGGERDGGHYWAYVKYGFVWYKYNDDRVSIVEDPISDYKKDTPCIVLYELSD